LLVLLGYDQRIAGLGVFFDSKALAQGHAFHRLVYRLFGCIEMPVKRAFRVEHFPLVSVFGTGTGR